MTAIITAVLSGLLGGIVGAYIQRSTQHRMWLLQQRAQAFADFLRAFEESRSRVTDIISNTDDYQWQNYDHRAKINEAYKPTLMNEKIVRLFLSINNRETFSLLLDLAPVMQGKPIRNDTDLSEFNRVINTIQEILESELVNPKWVHISLIDHIAEKIIGYIRGLTG